MEKEKNNGIQKISYEIDSEFENLKEEIGRACGATAPLIVEKYQNQIKNLCVEMKNTVNSSHIEKKPIVIKDNGWNNGYNCVCPSCNRPLDTEDGNPNFCSYCGQKLDWSKN